eukprot:m.400272 g.400272  ORF g.400272 m.400272 type:complete len:94 (+) comp16782_c0_seq3:1257-1538(+)
MICNPVSILVASHAAVGSCISDSSPRIIRVDSVHMGTSGGCGVAVSTALKLGSSSEHELAPGRVAAVARAAVTAGSGSQTDTLASDRQALKAS